MRYIGVFLLICTSFLADAQSTVANIGLDHIIGGQILLESDEGWQYLPSESANDESLSAQEGWVSMAPSEISSDHVDEKGLFDGWFRLRFQLSEELEVDQWWFRYISWAPADVYLDGEKIASFGNTDHNSEKVEPYVHISQEPVMIDLESGVVYDLRLHIVDQLESIVFDNIRSRHLESTYGIALQSPGYVERYMTLIGSHRYLFGTLRIGLCVLLVLFFFLLYLLNDKDIVIGYITTITLLFTLSSIGFEMKNTKGAGYDAWVAYSILTRLFFAFASFLTPILLTKILKVQLTKVQKYILYISLGLIAVPLLLDVPIRPQIGVMICIVLTIFLLFKHRSKLKGSAWIVAIGLILALISAVILVSSIFYFNSNTFSGIQIMASFCSLIFPMSLLIYLAMRFREVNRDIANKADHIIRMTESQRQEAIQRSEILEQQVKALKENDILKMYVDDSVINFMGDKADDQKLMSSETIEASVMFVDICGFTSYSEKAAPSDVVTLLNSYFDIMAKEIVHHGGFIDKFMGDAIMAVFRGAYHIKSATSCALKIRDQINALSSASDQETFDAQVSIGINTGEMVSGNIGSESIRRLDYTVIGAVVNIAQRLEAIAADNEIIISAHAYDQVKGDFTFVNAGEVQLKHVDRPMNVYKVIGVRKVNESTSQ